MILWLDHLRVPVDLPNGTSTHGIVEELDTLLVPSHDIITTLDTLTPMQPLPWVCQHWVEGCDSSLPTLSLAYFYLQIVPPAPAHVRVRAKGWAVDTAIP